MGLDNCGQFAVCFNTEGSFTCQCLPGYQQGSGQDCIGQYTLPLTVPPGQIVRGGCSFIRYQ